MIHEDSQSLERSIEEDIMLLKNQLYQTLRRIVCFHNKTLPVLLFGLLIIGCSSFDDVLEPDMNIQLVASPSQVDLMEYSSLTATVNKVEEGEPLIGYEARFSFAQNQSGGALTQADGTTNASGQAFCLYQAGTQPGVDIVQVVIDNDQSASTRIMVAGGESDTIVLTIMASPPTVSNFERSTITVRVTRQSDGAPMAGMDVNFSISKNERNRDR